MELYTRHECGTSKTYTDVKGLNMSKGGETKFWYMEDGEMERSSFYMANIQRLDIK